MSANGSEPAKRKQRRKQEQVSLTDARLDAGADGDQVDTSRAVRLRPSAVWPTDQRARVWEMHLRGMQKQRIAAELGIHRNTVSKYIADCYREFGAERRARLKGAMEGAVARMRRIQAQAWSDHEADDERERWVIEHAEPGTRYQSQRSHYLRIALDAEKEVARLEGLYADDVPDILGVLFRIERVERVEQVERVERVVGEEGDDDSA